MAFHQTMPEEVYMYGVPYNYYEDLYVVMVHGISHEYASKRAAELMGKDES